MTKGALGNDDLQSDLQQMLDAAAKSTFKSEVGDQLLKDLDSQIDDVRTEAGEAPRTRK
jgi:hypothetical protein